MALKKDLDYYDYRELEATLEVDGAKYPIMEWGIDLTMDNKTVTFHQGYREVTYGKTNIRKMDLKIRNPWPKEPEE